MSADLTALLADLGAETDDLLGVLDRHPEAMATVTAATPWTVADTVGHLWFFDREARRAVVDPDGFTAGLAELMADVGGATAKQLDAAGELGDGLLPAWRDQRAALIGAFGDADPAQRLPWYGPPMSPATSATARLMETWAHGQDIVDALGELRLPTDRLRHICFLGVRTRDFSYAVRGLPPSTAPVFVSLTPPSGGEAWTWGPAEADDRITGPALDFCLLVTQRRLPADLDLTVAGEAAAQWVSLAQAFAGLPTSTDPARGGMRA